MQPKPVQLSALPAANSGTNVGHCRRCVVPVSLLRIGWLYLHKDLLSSFFAKSEETFTESVSLPLRRNFVQLKTVTNYVELLTNKNKTERRKKKRNLLQTLLYQQDRKQDFVLLWIFVNF